MAGGAVLLTADVRSGGSVSVAIGGATSAPVTSSGTDVVLHFDKPLPKLGAKVVVELRASKATVYTLGFK